MQTENRFFDDLARVAGGALNTLTGLKTEVEAMVRQQFERILTDMNLVTRDEFEAVQAMAIKARAENEELAARIAALEESLSGKSIADAISNVRANNDGGEDNP
ncbi:MAG: accessory factor UbiK family protein [Rhodospirillales bacterium]|nr:accessory factor UbiK family protein [Rhodospirillales bacterium]